ncbi:general secretion pathway protein GspB [Shewanella sp. Isolate11]|uniref:general secretion pathway protein GspB n=1 Tax=Shewanella sp. Isolate11 TaxID=2908530 RepID=UPI001EFC509A|nr:general secretion pathway protein GspB [Shewanella sp. Isolate11]MCG9695899.1 general secretion pathway protein GspB [Shewanella sp. Isolate11]
MSILLDAVTRAKQQDQMIDPVITPRAQYQQMNQGLHLGVKLALLLGLIALMVLIAWLLSPVSPLGKNSDNSSSTQPISQTAAQPELERQNQKPSATQLASTTVSAAQVDNPNASVKLAGKVALPVAVERPVTTSYYQPSVQPQAAQMNLAKGSNTIAMATAAEELDSEPIILGANSNQRGQDLLNSLQAQVDEAANEVGLEQGAPVEARQAEQAQSTQLTEPSDNLVAAFQAALAEVEKQNAIAKPVTEPELDPIPETKADDIPSYGQLPAGVQLQVPEFNIMAHVYSSNANNRWLNVDGAELQEGDSIGGKLKIIEIRPRDVVLEVSGTQFKVPAI